MVQIQLLLSLLQFQTQIQAQDLKIQAHKSKVYKALNKCNKNLSSTLKCLVHWEVMKTNSWKPIKMTLVSMYDSLWVERSFLTLKDATTWFWWVWLLEISSLELSTTRALIFYLRLLTWQLLNISAMQLLLKASSSCRKRMLEDFMSSISKSSMKNAIDSI